MSPATGLTPADLGYLVWKTVPVILVDMHTGIIHQISEPAELLFGYNTRYELLKKDIDLLVPSGSRGKHKEHRQDYEESPRLRPMGIEGSEIRGLKKDGTTFPVAIHLCPVVVHEVHCVFCIVADMTNWIGSLGKDVGDK